MQKFASDLNHHDLDQTVQTSITTTDEPNITYKLFFDKIASTREKHMPLTKKKFNRKVDKVNDWMTPALLRSVNTKNKLYIAYQRIKNNREERIEKYRLLKNYEAIFNKVIRTRKADFYNKQFSDYNGNIKKTWENIKTLLNKNKKPATFPSVFVNDEGYLTVEVLVSK